MPHPRRHDFYVVAAVGLLLALFVVFGAYAIGAGAALRREENQVLARNRQDTTELLQVQQDTLQLAELVHDMVLTAATRPVPPAVANLRRPLPQPAFAVWGVTFRRLRLDLERALAAEARFAPEGRDADARRQLETELAQFWSISDQAFRLARLGYPQSARNLVERELLPQRRVVAARLAGWLAQNRRRQTEAQATITAIGTHLMRNFVVMALVFLAIGAGFSAWAIRTNRRAFRRLGAANARLLTIQEETLAQLTRDLHDEFGQLLAAAGANLARAATLTPEPESAAEIGRARAAVHEAQGKMRDLVRGLRPAMLDDFGLAPALSAASEQFARQTGLDVRFAAEGTVPALASERAVHLYRIAQEALTNAARHARARVVRVTLRGDADRVELLITDDGPGFDPGRAAAGSGLDNMRQRAALLGGALAIASVPGSTCVRVVVPLMTKRSDRAVAG